MDQYAADNERLRRKVSELGTRMEYYKAKVIKYRGMYMKDTGQDESAPSNTTPKSPAHIRNEQLVSSVNRKLFKVLIYMFYSKLTLFTLIVKQPNWRLVQAYAYLKRSLVLLINPQVIK